MIKHLLFIICTSLYFVLIRKTACFHRTRFVCLFSFFRERNPKSPPPSLLIQWLEAVGGGANALSHAPSRSNLPGWVAEAPPPSSSICSSSLTLSSRGVRVQVSLEPDVTPGATSGAGPLSEGSPPCSVSLSASRSQSPSSTWPRHARTVVYRRPCRALIGPN